MENNEETTTPAKGVKGKRVSKRSRPETPTLQTPHKSDQKAHIWTDAHLTSLIDHLKTNGFQGDYSEIQQFVPNFSEATIKNLFSHLSRWSEPNSNEESSDIFEEKQTQVTLAPIEEWISMVKEVVEVQRLGGNSALIVEWIAKFEEHPDPADCCGVDYKAIYFYISALLEGHVPKQLDAPSASKLYIMFQQLVSTISQSAKTSQELLLKTVKKPKVSNTITRYEKNEHLRERRRTVWTEQEMELARIVKLDDLDPIKKVYCEKHGLNPFGFPPSI